MSCCGDTELGLLCDLKHVTPHLWVSVPALWKAGNQAVSSGLGIKVLLHHLLAGKEQVRQGAYGCWI